MVGENRQRPPPPVGWLQNYMFRARRYNKWTTDLLNIPLTSPHFTYYESFTLLASDHVRMQPNTYFRNGLISVGLQEVTLVLNKCERKLYSACDSRACTLRMRRAGALVT